MPEWQTERARAQRAEDRVRELEADLLRLREAGDALAALVALKDGPRGVAYEAAKPGAWARARRVVDELNQQERQEPE